MNYIGQICCNITISYFKDVTTQFIRKSPLLPWKVSTWIMVKTCVLYTSHKIHPLLKFFEIDEASVNLLDNYSISDCHKIQIWKLQINKKKNKFVCFWYKKDSVRDQIKRQVCLKKEQQGCSCCSSLYDFDPAQKHWVVKSYPRSLQFPSK